jgi:hypothetical protein
MPFMLNILLSGKAEAEESHPYPASAGWLFLNLISNPFFGKENSKSPPRWL